MRGHFWRAGQGTDLNMRKRRRAGPQSNKDGHRLVASTRFWQEDLDSVMQISYSTKDLDKAREVCPVCRHDELVEGNMQGTGLVYFVPKKTKFWTLKSSFVGTTGRMCTRCGAISWFGDTVKLAKLRISSLAKEANETAPAPGETPP